MITPPANVEILDNSTTPRENTGTKQFAGHGCHTCMHSSVIYSFLPTKTVVVFCLGPAHVSMDTVMV